MNLLLCPRRLQDKLVEALYHNQAHLIFLREQWVTSITIATASCASIFCSTTDWRMTFCPRVMVPRKDLVFPSERFRNCWTPIPCLRLRVGPWISVARSGVPVSSWPEPVPTLWQWIIRRPSSEPRRLFGIQANCLSGFLPKVKEGWE